MTFGVFYSAFVLNASLPVKEALARIKLHGPRTRVVIRRQLGYQLFYYPFTVAEVLQRLSAADDSLSVQIALQLHEENAAPTLAPGKSGEPGTVSVVLEGEQVSGVFDEPGQLAAAPKPSTPSAPGPLAAKRSPTKVLGRSGRTTIPGARGPLSGIDYELGMGRDPRPTGARRALPERLEAFPLVDAPEKVAPGEPFELTIGLSRTPVPEVLGGSISVTVSPGSKTVDFSVVVAADGFDAPEGWRRTLTVPVAQPEAARVTVPLVPQPLSTPEPRLSFLLVHFSRNGEACGMASRKIIVRNPAEGEIPVIGRGRPWLGEREPAAAISFDPRQTPPDLTIRIAKPDQDDGTGKFVLSFESPHAIEVPDPGVFPMDLGKDVQTFARTVIDAVSQNEGRPTIGLTLRGKGVVISDALPQAFRDVLQQVWDKVYGRDHRIPTVLLLSAEAYVPWELALLDPPLDPARPPFLGAQVAMARWVLGARGIPLPPAREVSVRQMAVVAGDYKSLRNVRPLPEAIAEGKELAKQYGAIPLKATSQELTALLDAKLPTNGETVGVDAIHFACHGEVDSANQFTGRIYLDDASLLSSDLFRSAAVGKTNAPFLFLNACQVAQAGELLNEYGGFAGSALRAGFRGFVAPLWNVSDRIAREIAVEFYRRAFAGTPGAPESVAAILQDIRRKYLAAGDATPQATYLAYVFYGHPNLLLSRQT